MLIGCRENQLLDAQGIALTGQGERVQLGLVELRQIELHQRVLLCLRQGIQRDMSHVVLGP